MRSRADALNGCGVSELPMLLTTTSVPRAFMPASQLLSSPRDIPTSATTAAMPIETPNSVSPVRTGRRMSPRTTIRKNVISCFPKRSFPICHNASVLHLDDSRCSLCDAHVVSHEHERHVSFVV